MFPADVAMSNIPSPPVCHRKEWAYERFKYKFRSAKDGKTEFLIARAMMKFLKKELISLEDGVVLEIQEYQFRLHIRWKIGMPHLTMIRDRLEQILTALQTRSNPSRKSKRTIIDDLLQKVKSCNVDCLYLG